MILINLLPYREEARRVQRLRFFVMAALVSFCALLLGGAVYISIDAQIENQRSENEFLQNEIAILDKQIVEIKTLKDKIGVVLARKQVIENLQKDRGETVHLLSEMVTRVPDGVYLRSLKQDAQRVSLSGYAQSNARVSALMRNIEASPWFASPQLIEVKAATLDGRRVNEFSVNFVLTRAPAEVAKKK